jgi:hypothetical protein
MDETLVNALAEQRQQIAEDVERKMMPICVCSRCDNLFEGRLVQEAINIIKGGSK